MLPFWGPWKAQMVLILSFSSLNNGRQAWRLIRDVVERLRNAQWRTYEFATEEDMKMTNCKPYALFETAESKRRNDPVLPTPEEVVLSRKKAEAAEKAKEKARNLRRGW